MMEFDENGLLPGQRHINDRYFADKISNMYGHEMWSVFDLNTVPAEPVRDERKDAGTGRKKRQRFWKGSYADAIHYCGLLNKEYVEQGLRARTMLDNLSQSQRIHYANDAARRRSVRGIPTGTPPSHRAGELAGSGVSPFGRCDRCKKMVRDDHKC